MWYSCTAQSPQWCYPSKVLQGGSDNFSGLHYPRLPLVGFWQVYSMRNERQTKSLCKQSLFWVLRRGFEEQCSLIWTWNCNVNLRWPAVDNGHKNSSILPVFYRQERPIKSCLSIWKTLFVRITFMKDKKTCLRKNINEINSRCVAH